MTGAENSIIHGMSTSQQFLITTTRILLENYILAYHYSHGSLCSTDTDTSVGHNTDTGHDKIQNKTGDGDTASTVSYTHLTLPTIYSV